VRIGIDAVRYPSAEEFLQRETMSSPLAEPIAALAPETREALVGDLREAVRDCTDDDGIMFPIEILVVLTRRG
jgi:hypothetical protein